MIYHFPHATQTYGLCAMGLPQFKAYWPCVGLRPVCLKRLRSQKNQTNLLFNRCLFLVEPEGGDLAADGADVAGGDGAHDEEADEDGDADA